jgi:hypothetical protein
MSTPGMEVTDMTTFSEDTSAAGKLSQESNPVSLTRDELEALSPSERPKNPLIVDRIVEGRTPSGEGLDPVNYKSLMPEGHLAVSLQLDKQPPHHLDKHPPLQLEQHSLHQLDQQSQHNLGPHKPHLQPPPHHKNYHAPHNLHQDSLDKSNSIPLLTVQQPKQTDNPKPSLTACYKQISTSDQAKLNFPGDTSQINQDEPLDLSKHDPESDRILKQSIQQISTHFQSQNNLPLPLQGSKDLDNKEKDLTELLEISNLSNELMTETEAEAKELFTATADVDCNDPLIIPFPEFEAENLEKLLNESPDGIIMSVDDDGKMFQIPALNSDHDPLACEESGNKNDVRLSSPSVQQDDTKVEIESLDNVESDNAIQDNVELDNAIQDDKLADSDEKVVGSDDQDRKSENINDEEVVKENSTTTAESNKLKDESITLNTDEPETIPDTKTIETTSALDDVNDMSDDNINDDHESSVADDNIQSNEEDICDKNSSPVTKKTKRITKSVIRSAITLPFRLNSLPPSRRSSRLSTHSSPNKYKSMLNYNKLPRKRKEPCTSTDTIEESKVDDGIEEDIQDNDEDNVPVRKSLRTKKKNINHMNDSSSSRPDEVSDDEDFEEEEESSKASRKRIRNSLDSSKVKEEHGKEKVDKVKKRKLEIRLSSISLLKKKPALTESEMVSCLV